jgi:hypothetical protein
MSQLPPAAAETPAAADEPGVPLELISLRRQLAQAVHRNQNTTQLVREIDRQFKKLNLPQKKLGADFGEPAGDRTCWYNRVKYAGPETKYEGRPVTYFIVYEADDVEDDISDDVNYNYTFDSAPPDEVLDKVCDLYAVNQRHPFTLGIRQLARLDTSFKLSVVLIHKGVFITFTDEEIESRLLARWNHYVKDDDDDAIDDDIEINDKLYASELRPIYGNIPLAACSAAGHESPVRDIGCNY